VNFGRGGGVLKCGKPIRNSAGCNRSGIPYRSRVDVSEKLRPLDSLCRLDSLEVSVPSHAGLDGGGLILSYQVCQMVVDAT